MRIVWPDRRTLPSSTVATFSLCATVAISGCSPWNEKEDVRAATCNSLMRDSELRSSSVSPSEKYSWSLSPLMLMNGSTAMECGGGLKAAAAAGAAPVLEAVLCEAVLACECCGRQKLSAMRYASPAATNALMTHSTAFDGQFGCSDRLAARATVDPDGVGAAARAGASGTRSFCIRSTNDGAVSPPGKRVHCT